MTGSPRAARAVGYAMAACTDPAVPCHRVMARDGTIREHAFGPGVQRALLEAEGVPFTPDGRVDLSRCRWGRAVKSPSNPCAFLLLPWYTSGTGNSNQGDFDAHD